jgi:hypothetical protein
MTAALSTPVVAVFKDSGQADLAVEALRQAGFVDDQIAVTSAPAEGPDATDEGDGGAAEMRTLVTVRPDKRREEAVTILKAHGAYGKGSPLV